MAYVKVLARGQLTIPRDLREHAKIEPGDYVEVTPAGPGRLEIRIISPHRLSDVIARDRQSATFDVGKSLRQAEEAEADALIERIHRHDQERIGV